MPPGLHPTHPLPSEYGTYKTVKARFWSWLSGEGPRHISRCSLFARKQSRHPRLVLVVDPSFRALSGRLKFTVRRHKFNKDSLFLMTSGLARKGSASCRIQSLSSELWLPSHAPTPYPYPPTPEPPTPKSNTQIPIPDS